jgi:DnaJ-domain-containing protein 1
MTTKIIITRDADDLLITMKSADKETFAAGIAALKENIAPGARTFDGDTKQWRITAKGRAGFDGWLAYMRASHKAAIEWTDGRAEKPRERTPSTADAYAVLYLAPGAPPQVVKAAYRELAKLHHPDTSRGETAKMQVINEAYERLRFAA